MLAEIFQLTAEPVTTPTGIAWVMLIIFFGSYLFEDGAVIFSAWVAAMEIIPTPLAFIAIFFGIITGDALLYLLGKSAHKWTYLRTKLLAFPKFDEIKQRFSSNYFWNVALIRFMPGMRSPSYTLCGFWDLSFSRFLFAATSSTMAWTFFVFLMVTFIGKELFEDTAFMFVFPLVILAILILLNRRKPA